jgi:hypothetical protein
LPRRHEAHEEEKPILFSSSCFRVFVANDAADYPDAAESSESRTSPGFFASWEPHIFQRSTGCRAPSQLNCNPVPNAFREHLTQFLKVPTLNALAHSVTFDDIFRAGSTAGPLFIVFS